MEYSDRFNNFFLSYGGEEGLKSASKGTKSVCFEAWNKAIKRSGETEEEFSKQIRNGYISYMKNRNAAHGAGEFVPKLKMLSTFLNQEAWDCGHDEDTGDLLLKTAVHTCSESGCDSEPIYYGDEIRLCQSHYLELGVYPEHRELVKEMMEQYGKPEGQTWKEWALGVVKEIRSF